ncbi:MAG: LysR family transcriptional regulator [Christensenellales bacterium]
MDSLEIRYIHGFSVLADTGGFQEAADQLFISQSSLSKHIKKQTGTCRLT